MDRLRNPDNVPCRRGLSGSTAEYPFHHRRRLALGCLGFQGNKIVKTPCLDSLAEEGTVFENTFATTSICSVSRASLLTGQWMSRHGVDDFVKGLSPDQWKDAWPAQLRKAGYRTGFVGKFGVGDGKQAALAESQFDFWKGLPGQGPLDFIDPKDPDHVHNTAKIGNDALDFLGSTPAEQPFCLAVSFCAVHARDGRPREFEPDRRDEGLYTDTVIPSPATATEAAFNKLPDFVKSSEARRRWGWRFDTPEKTQRTLRDYYRLITGLDREVSRFREVLERRGLKGRTVIIFIGDNGFALGDRGLADKWFMYEESLRLPLLIYDPRSPAEQRGQRVKAMALNVDMAPTLLDLAGLVPPERMQGRSLLSWMKGETPPQWRSDFFYEHHSVTQIIPPSEGVRTRDWKYIRWTDRDPLVEELYDLRSDPLEQSNLLGDPNAAARLDELKERWEALRREMK